MAFEWWAASATSRWLGDGISYFTTFSYHTRWSWRWDPQYLMRWSVSFSIVDDLLWSVVTAFESVVLASMLCFFFVFCGCSI